MGFRGTKAHRPPPAIPEEWSATAHPFFHAGWKASYLVGKRIGRVAFVAGASYHTRGMFVDANGAFVGLYATQGDIMDSTARNLYGKATVTLGPDQEAAVSVSDFTLERDAQFVAVNGNRAQGRLTTSIAGDPRPVVGDPARNDARTVAAEYRHGNILGGELSAQAYVYDYRALFEGGTFGGFFRLTPTGPPFLDQSAITSEKLGAKVTYALPAERIGGVRALVGLDVTHDDSAQVLARSDRSWVPPTVLVDVAPSVQVQRPLSRHVLVSGGVRLEAARLRVDDYVTIAAEGNMPVAGGSPSFIEALPNLGVIVYPSAPLSIYASYNEGFTMPDAGRVLRSVNRPGQSVDTLLNIDPIVTGNLEVGGTWNGERARVHAAYYRSNADRGSLLELSPAGIFNVQRQRTEIGGLDLSLEVPMAGRWLAGATYSVIEGRFDSNRDDVVDTDLDGLNIGPNRLSVFLEGGRGPLGGRLQVARLFARDFSGPAARPDIRFDGYTIGDLSLALTMRSGIVRLGVDNVLNEQYVAYFSQVEPNRGAGTFFAGPGRTLLLTLERRF